MNSLVALRALLFAGELLAGSTLIIALAWLAATQKRASARHLAWTGAFGALLMLPLLAAVVPSAVRIPLPAPMPDLPPAHMINVPDAVIAAPPLPAPAPSGFSFDMPTFAMALGALWLVGVAAILLRLAIGAACLAFLKHRSRLYALAPDDLPKIATTRRECELRLAASDNGPITWGMFRPVILLPRNAVSWTRERLHAVLLHELAHIRRRDSLVQFLSQLVCAAYWPNPLVWMGASRLRREAEMAADDAVLIAGLKPSHYAGELLQLASEFRAQPRLAAMPLFMAAPSSLEARVTSVLSPTHIRSGVTSMDIFKVLSAGLLATTAIAFTCPSLAQDAPPQPPSPPVSVAPIAPPATEALDSATVPDAPPAPPAPHAPPAPPAPPADLAASDAHVHGIIVDEHGVHRLNAEDMRRLHADLAKVRRETREAIAKVRPEIERAIAQAHVSREEAERAVREAQPQIDAAAAEVARVRPEIEKAMIAAKPEIDAAMAKVRAELAKDHFDADVKMRVDEALKRAEIRIDAAQARMRERESRRVEESDETPGTPDTPDND